MSDTIFLADTEVDVAAHRVRGREGWIQLKPKSMAVLAHLMQHAGEVCSRRAIMDAVWGEVDVTEEVLNHAVHELRRAFDDDSHDPRVIETIPRAGYRLIAPVERPAASGFRPPLRTAVILAVSLLVGASLVWVLLKGGEATEPTRLAVLPFENMAPDGGFDYFSDGLTEELIARLNHVNPDRLDVIARTSVMIYKQRQESLAAIAEQLDVDYIVEGSVRRSADRIRVTAQLIETEGQTHLWAASFDRSMGDVLTLQSELARTIARQARVPLDGLPQPAAPSLSPAALQHFLRGKELVYQFHPSAYAQAVKEFDRTLEIHPEYAAALGWQAMAQAGLAFSAPTEEARMSHARAASAAAEKALALDSRLGVAKAANGWLSFTIRWEFERSQHLYAQALEIDENSWWIRLGYAELLSALGRHEEAIAQMRVAHELDPVNPIVQVERAAIHSHAGQFREALAIIDQGLEVMPNHQEFHDRRSNHLERLGRFEEAIETRKRYAELRGREYDAAAHRQSWREEGERGYWEYLLDAPGWSSGGISRAKLLALLGRETEALDLLAEAVESRRPSAVFLGVYPEFESLADHPRYRQLLKAAGLASE